MAEKAFIHALSEIRTMTAAEVRKSFGGKALGLLEADLLGIHIPQTWLISSQHFEDFDFSKETSAAVYIEKHFAKELAKLPDLLFAVRSSSEFEDSGDHSFAGIFESKLNVKKTDLAHAISDVWHSCHSMRVSSYQKEGARIRMAVILQPMIQAKYAGVAFSRHPSPATLFENQNIVIEFAPTSGEKVVQGEVTPFRLSGTMESISSATDASWLHPLLKALAVLKSTERHEVDMEFVIDKQETFYLVQQRPVSKMHASHTLDLSNYQRKYKRALLSFDIELLINACSLFLAPYLEVPYQMERWMVMITGKDGQQELWVHELLNDGVTYYIAHKMQEDASYLERLQKRYAGHFQAILEHNYERFFDSKKPVDERFFSWCEWITPFLAHYYVPMFMIDALHLLLKRKMLVIDAKNAEADLFFLGTEGISSLMDLLHAELYPLKNHAKEKILPKLEMLAKRYGFLRCHQVYEEGYSAEDLLNMLKELEAPHKQEEKEKSEPLLKKYLQDAEMQKYFAHFRSWMKIRNQEMEYVMYAMLSCRPLFQEICDLLKVSLKDFWNSSKEMIQKALRAKDSHYITKFPHDHLSIFRSYGRTHLSNTLKILAPSQSKCNARQNGLWRREDQWKGIHCLPPQ